MPTSEPVAMIVTEGAEDPSFRMYAPLSTPETAPCVVRSTVRRFWRESRKPAGLLRLMTDFHDSVTSLASAGRKTAKFGIARSAAKCSIG